MKIKILYLILFLVMLSSCVTQRKCLQKFPPTITIDSVITVEIREVPVPIPGDTVKVVVPIDCPDQELVNTETLRLKQTIKILNGKLYSTTLIKPDTIYVSVTDTLIRVKEVRVPQPIEVIPKRFKQYRNAVFLIFALACAWLGWKVFKMFKK